MLPLVTNNKIMTLAKGLRKVELKRRTSTVVGDLLEKAMLRKTKGLSLNYPLNLQTPTKTSRVYRQLTRTMYCQKSKIIGLT